MTATIEAPRTKLNIPEVTPRLHLPDDLPTVIHPYPSNEFPRYPQEAELQVNRNQILESRQFQTQTLEAMGLSDPIPGKIKSIANEFVGIAFRNDISTFHNGDKKERFTDKEPRQELNLLLRTMLTEKQGDLFDEYGGLKRGSEKTWDNISEIAPAIAGILLNKENNIRSVSRDQMVNVFSFAVDVARDPSVLGRTEISVGFGGSADSYTSSRLPSYGLPAQLIATEINEFYQKRVNTSIDKARVKKYQDAQIAKQKEVYGDTIPPHVEDHIARVSEGYLKAEKEMEATDNTVQLLPMLTEDELEGVKKLYAIPDKPVKLRFFSGAEAGIVSNFPDNAREVRERREENWDVIKDFTKEYFPPLAEQMDFQNDIPWNEHSIEQQAVLEYGAHILRTSKKDSIKETLAVLEGLGFAKGGEQGKELAAEYAFLHVSFFKDRLHLPAAYTNFFGVEHVFDKPQVGIMIGGRSEEMFAGIREYVAEHATPEGLRDFALLKAARLELQEVQNAQQRASTMHLNGSAPEIPPVTQEIQKLRHMASRIDQWKAAITKRRETYGQPDARIAPSDRPVTTISEISVTELAPYYEGPGDEPYGIDPVEQIATIQTTDFTPKDTKGKTPKQIAKEKHKAEIHAKGVIAELEFMEKGLQKMKSKAA